MTLEQAKEILKHVDEEGNIRIVSQDIDSQDILDVFMEACHVVSTCAWKNNNVCD